VNDKIDRLSELKIDRSEQPQEPRRWPWILAGVVVAAAVVGFMLRAILNGPIDVTAETVRLTQTGSGASSVLDASGYVVARRHRKLKNCR